MRLRLSPSSGLPIYRQIIEQVSHQIACDGLRTGERLPSVRELARALPANQNTVLKAYEALERDGVIVRRHGNGTFVADGVSPLSSAQRRKKVGEVLVQAAVLASHLKLQPEDVHKLLNEQIRRIAKRRGGDRDQRCHTGDGT